MVFVRFVNWWWLYMTKKMKKDKKEFEELKEFFKTFCKQKWGLDVNVRICEEQQKRKKNEI